MWVDGLSFHMAPRASAGKRKQGPTVFARSETIHEFQRARTAGHGAGAGYPPRHALACERGAARTPPWITAGRGKFFLDAIPLSLMPRRELQAENDSF